MSSFLWLGLCTVWLCRFFTCTKKLHNTLQEGKKSQKSNMAVHWWRLTDNPQCTHQVVQVWTEHLKHAHLHKTCMKWATSHFTIFHTAFWQPFCSTSQGLPQVPRDFSHHHGGRDAFPSSKLLDPSLHHGVWSGWIEGKWLFLIKEDLTETSSRCSLVSALFSLSNLFVCFSLCTFGIWFCD